MKKNWWIALSIILFSLNIFLGIEIKNLKENSLSKGISLNGLNNEIALQSKQSLLTLIIYFSESSCESCMKESYYWNKLFMDLSKEEIFIIGLVPEKEDAERIRDKNEILFPIVHDKGGKFAKKFCISISPFKVIIDLWGNLLYMSSGFSEKDYQESFYFEVLEYLRNARMKEQLQKSQ